MNLKAERPAVAILACLSTIRLKQANSDAKKHVKLIGTSLTLPKQSIQVLRPSLYPSALLLDDHVVVAHAMVRVPPIP
ncbi:hypothetical protein PC123_g10423 [Phytophthora cactorum]|nr:hypothetical protein PC123_g10423 [Phytophthora cactorum]